MTIEKPTAIALNFTFAVLGCVIMLCNLAYAIRHAIQKKTKFNFALVLCAVLWTSSFIPLFITSKLTIDLTNVRPSLANMNQFITLANTLRAFNFIYGIGSLNYLLLEQTRFKLIKGILPYPAWVDHAFALVTLAVWCATVLAFGVIDVTNTTRSGIAIAAYVVYGLTVDNSLSFTFIYQLYKNRQKLHKGAANPEFVKVVKALICLCTLSWLGLIIFAVGNFYYAKDNITRTLMFRICYIFTPLQYTAALVFMYSVKTLMAQPKSATSSQTASKTSSSRPTSTRPPQKSAAMTEQV
ncbi:hypothetical protein HDV00_005678 [Rhizophlyctis rosea]|nr:hypothetical protein HDV00_005678 [Rhizophlyctis rosea]